MLYNCIHCFIQLYSVSPNYTQLYVNVVLHPAQNFFRGWTAPVVLGLLIVEVSRSHTRKHARTHSVGILWESDQPVVETPT